MFYASNVYSLKLLNLSKDVKLISNLKEENISIIDAFFDNIKFVNWKKEEEIILETYIRDEVKSCSFASFQRKISKKGRSSCSHMSNVRL